MLFGQFDVAKSKHLTVLQFMEILAHTLTEYEEMVEKQGFEPGRAKFLQATKIRELLADAEFQKLHPEEYEEWAEKLKAALPATVHELNG